MSAIRELKGPSVHNRVHVAAGVDEGDVPSREIGLTKEHCRERRGSGGFDHEPKVFMSSGDGPKGLVVVHLKRGDVQAA